MSDGVHGNGYAIRIDGVTKRFGATLALDAVSFDVPRNSIYGLLGPNGAGKTTLFSIASNFLQPTAGRIEVLGIDVKEIGRLRGRLSILPQDALFERNTPIGEQMAFFLQLIGRDRAGAIREAEETLERVGLGIKVYERVTSLSHGMVKRLGIAQAFLGEPEVIFLDEPTAGLDPRLARQIRDLIRELRERATIVVSSHNLAEIEDLCDRVVILDHGRVVTEGAVEEIVSASRELEIATSLAIDEETLGAIGRIDGVRAIAARGAHRYRLAFSEGDDAARDRTLGDVLRVLLDRGIVPRAIAEAGSLEEHFLRVTRTAEGRAEA